jgi:hypothetical protein
VNDGAALLYDCRNMQLSSLNAATALLYEGRNSSPMRMPQKLSHMCIPQAFQGLA